MAQQNRRRARKGGSGSRRDPARDAGVNADGADRPFPELTSGEEQLAEAQMALGRPDPGETPGDAELTAFEEQEAGRAPAPPVPAAPAPAAGALSTRSTARTRRSAEAPTESAEETGSAGRAGSAGHELAPHAPSVSLPARTVGFLKGSWRELQRVQWPDRRQVFQATGVVLGFVIVAGAFLGVASFAAQKIVNLILYGHG